MANVGFEPTPFQTSALNWRLRPLGQLTTDNNLHTHKQTQNKPQTTQTQNTHKQPLYNSTHHTHSSNEAHLPPEYKQPHRTHQHKTQSTTLVLIGLIKPPNQHLVHAPMWTVRHNTQHTTHSSQLVCTAAKHTKGRPRATALTPSSAISIPV